MTSHDKRRAYLSLGTLKYYVTEIYLKPLSHLFVVAREAGHTRLLVSIFPSASCEARKLGAHLGSRQ